MSADLPTIAGPIDMMRKGRRSRALVGLAASIVGCLLAIGGFYGVIVDALGGTGTGTGLGLVVMLLGLAFTLIGLVIGIIGLVVGGHRYLAVATIVVALIPEVFYAVVAISVRL
jgi:hypothetical protein